MNSGARKRILLSTKGSFQLKVYITNLARKQIRETVRQLIRHTSKQREIYFTWRQVSNLPVLRGTAAAFGLAAAALAAAALAAGCTFS